jgi:hypothetical protein
MLVVKTYNLLYKIQTLVAAMSSEAQTLTCRFVFSSAFYCPNIRQPYAQKDNRSKIQKKLWPEDKTLT